MNDNLIRNLIITFFILIALWAVMDNFYMSWFKPSAFLERAREGVKDWWPFADFFRWFYGSSWWLWNTRIFLTFLVFVILFIVYLAILGRLDIQP